MSSPASSSTDGPETGSEPARGAGVPPARGGSALSAGLIIGLLALLVWGLSPRRVAVKPAPLEPVTTSCPTSQADFVPSNLTEVPGYPLGGLSASVKNRILLRLNMEPCTCGCAQSFAACRTGNPRCTVSPQAIDSVIKEEGTNPVVAGAPKPAGAR